MDEHLGLRRLAGNCGVEVRGVDVRTTDDETISALRRLVGQHAALVLPGQQLTRGDEETFASRWGTPQVLGGRSPIVTLDSTQSRRARPQGGAWHSDMSWAPETPYATFLYALTIPDVGGDTIVANQCAAHEALPGELRERIADLSAEHHHPDPPGRFASGTAIHPVVRLIPESGRRALFVNPAFTRRICGMDEQASRRLLWNLYRLATRPEATYRHRWTPGDLLIWDNRCVLHYAIHDYTEPRLLHRITVQPNSST
jgi:taurine dioxygenase